MLELENYRERDQPSEAQLSLSLFPRAHIESQKNILPTLAITLSKGGKASFQPSELHTTNKEAHKQNEGNPHSEESTQLFKTVPSLQARPLNCGLFSLYILSFSSLNSSCTLPLAVHGAAFAGIGHVHTGSGAFLCELDLVVAIWIASDHLNSVLPILPLAQTPPRISNMFTPTGLLKASLQVCTILFSCKWPTAFLNLLHSYVVGGYRR